MYFLRLKTLQRVVYLYFFSLLRSLQFKQRATVSGTFDVVLGELSFRDGLYSTDQQVGYDVQGTGLDTSGLLLIIQVYSSTQKDSHYSTPTKTTLQH